MQAQRTTKTGTRNIASAGLLALFLALAAGSAETDSDAGKIASEPSAYSLTAEQLHGEYEANQIAADSKYKEKVVTVSGSVYSIGKDISDTAYIVIGGMGLNGVQCIFSKGQESQIGQLSKGQEVAAKGKVNGQLVGNELMRNCTLQN